MARNRTRATVDGDGQSVILAPRLLPVRTPPIKLDTLRHLRDELGRVYREARIGKIPTQDATRLAFVLGQLREMVLAMELERRVEILEGNRNEAG